MFTQVTQFLVPKNEFNNLKPLDLDCVVVGFTKGSVPGVTYIQHLGRGELESLDASKPNIQPMPEGISCSQRRDSLAKEGDSRAAKKEFVVTAGCNKPQPTRSLCTVTCHKVFLYPWILR